MKIMLLRSKVQQSGFVAIKKKGKAKSLVKPSSLVRKAVVKAKRVPTPLHYVITNSKLSKHKFPGPRTAAKVYALHVYHTKNKSTALKGAEQELMEATKDKQLAAARKARADELQRTSSARLTAARANMKLLDVVKRLEDCPMSYLHHAGHTYDFS